MKLTSHLKFGRPIREAFVLDDVIDVQARRGVFEYFRLLPYKLVDADRPDTTHVRHFMHSFQPETWKDDPLCSALLRIARQFLEQRGIRLVGVERIYANLNLFGDHQFAHDDGDVWTALSFVNDEWHPDWGGELMLYEPGRPAAPAWAIQPLPGRMVIFDGLIPHRGGVPSKHCLLPRISVALKLVRPKRSAGSRQVRSPR